MAKQDLVTYEACSLTALTNSGALVFWSDKGIIRIEVDEESLNRLRVMLDLHLNRQDHSSHRSAPVQFPKPEIRARDRKIP